MFVYTGMYGSIYGNRLRKMHLLIVLEEVVIMEKILIVDDSAVQAAQLKDILEEEYDITIAQTAEDGLRRANGGNFSLILLDVVMPGMDGFTLLKKLQEEIITQSIPVILITSLSDVTSEQRGLILGAVD